MINATSTATAAIIAALSLLISTGLLGAVFVYFRQLVEARIGAAHTATAIAITGEAVRAAEQIGKTHGLDAGAKYLEAVQRATTYLEAQGIAIGPNQLRTLIEGAVTQIKQANAAANAGPGVVLTGDSPTVNQAPPAPPVPVGPSPEQIIAAITTAVATVFPVTPAPDPAPVAVLAPVDAVRVDAVPVPAP